ncbi:hypothetical protein SH661x_003409 [Planctomicrobium sp. SH661]|uniref:hypothetical protein n=1 Tax=Planctomicrobium sp. SH661 TaxID=3448124 RepID=UPI003F5AED6D
MSQHSEELMFGSDSFLDVMCNMVGILIILIVVVLGMRVAPPPGSVPVAIAEEAAGPAPALPPVLEDLVEIPQLPEIKPSEEMLQQAAQLKEQNSLVARRLEELKAEEQKIAQRRLSQVDQINVLRSQIAEKVDTLRSDRSQISTLETNLIGLKAEVAALKQRLAETPPDEAPVEKLTHQLPPIGKVVTGDEIHFRLEGNKVTRVPIAELAQEVQRDIERRKEILISRSFYQGTTRPMEGYMMEYVLQRLSMTIADELRTGPGMVRIGVTSWIIRPVGPLRAETADEAMRPGSAFHNALKNAGPTATITFWVYPDSFDIHRKLTQLTHDANFWVASRPLPNGVPIAGSPQGSKSVAQ